MMFGVLTRMYEDKGDIDIMDSLFSFASFVRKSDRFISLRSVLETLFEMDTLCIIYEAAL